MSCSSRPSPASVGRVAIEAKLTLRQYVYNICLEKGLGQLFGTLYTLSIYPFVHNQLIPTLYEAHIVSEIVFYVSLEITNFQYLHTDSKIT